MNPAAGTQNLLKQAACRFECKLLGDNFFHRIQSRFDNKSSIDSDYMYILTNTTLCSYYNLFENKLENQFSPAQRKAAGMAACVTKCQTS